MELICCVFVVCLGTIRGYPVQIFNVKDSTFNQAIDSFSPGISLDAKSLSNSCLSLRDFPPVATAQNVKEAFGTISIGQVLPERNESGTVTGLCFVELRSEADARKAIQLLKDGVMICGRQVKVAFLPLEELHVCSKNLERFRGVVGAVMTTPPTQTDSPLSPGQSAPHRPPASNRPGPPFVDRSQSGGNGSYDAPPNQRGRLFVGPQRVFITGLPPSALERDIGDFFSDVGVIPQIIEIVYDEERMPVGNAYCQFASMQEAERALDKNGGFMGGHTVSVTLVENPDAAPVVSRHPATEENKMRRFSPYLDTNMNQSDHGPRGYGHPGPSDPYNRPSMGADGGNGYNPQMGPRFGGPRFGGGPRYPPGGSNRGNFSGSGGPGPRTRPNINMRIRMPGGPIPNGGGGRGGSDDGSPTPGFGAPGCVIALSNVPHKAIIADILDFFRGFQVNEKCVIRRFGPNGEPTGDARVAFLTPDEAELAVRTLQNEYLMNRRVNLSII
jgi:RNA recognition motif-containing protein